MASILKMFGRPRVGLLAVMLTLFLVVELFSQKAIAENPPPTGGRGGNNGTNLEAKNKTPPGDQNDTIPGPPPNNNSTGLGVGVGNDTSGTNSTSSSRSSNNGTEGAGVKCYVCSGTLDSDCITFPSPETQETKDCPSGYCYHEIHDSSLLATLSKRDCATSSQVECFKDKPDMTSVFPDILGKDKEDWNDLISCYGEDPSNYSSSGNSRILEMDEIHVDSNPTDKVTVFVCNSSLCTSAGGKVGRDGGFIYVLVAVALLMAYKAIPLQDLQVWSG